MEHINKKRRSANFTNNDKLLLINIVSKFKNIIENKKTDAVTAREKNSVWKNITEEFNSSGPSCPRDVECLKRCYENRKKLLRKSIAYQRRELYKTGGGLPDVPNIEKKEPGDDLLLSIVCDKVLKGLENHFDGDTTRVHTNLPQPNLLPVVHDEDDNLEIIYETDDKENSLMELDVAENNVELATNIITEDMFNQIERQTQSNNWKHYKVHDLKSRASNELVHSDTPHVQDAPNSTSNAKLHRRRPRTLVKSLTTSELSEKYNKLLDERLEIAQYQKQHLQNLIEMEKREHELRVELLKAQIEKEKNVK